MADSAWRVIGASVPGTAHQGTHLPCQDAHACRLSAEGDLLIAIADGAGSAACAHEGAALAVAHALNALAAHLEQPPELPAADAWPALLQTVFAATRQALIDHAAAAQAEVRDFATTLTCVVATDNLLVVGQIGDGVVIAVTERDDLFTAAHPQRGEYANETTFLTCEAALETLLVQVHPVAVPALAVMTDGLIRLAMQLPAYQPAPRFFQPLLAFIAEAGDAAQAEQDLAAFLASERVARRTDDDKTLVLARRQGSQ